jgi:hypothetical protein
MRIHGPVAAFRAATFAPLRVAARFARAAARAPLAVLVCASLLLGCGPSGPRTRAVYLLLDTSGTYANEVSKATAITNYLLGTLESGDSLGLARIDSGSFSERDVVARVTFDSRPSYTNQQKRAFRDSLDKFAGEVRGSRHTDITGGMLQAAEWLRETGARERYILVFSDLEEDLPDGYVRNFDIDMTSIHVVALNVTKLRSDNVDPREYTERLAHWEKRVVTGKGTFKVVNDLERLDGLLAP